MQKLLAKTAPLGVMTVCVLWCCWSQLRERTPLLAATEAKLPRIERKLLHPELSPPSERDPFLQPKPAPPPASEKVAAVKETKEEPTIDPRTLLPSIRLDATMPGSRPMAVINGQIVSAGERIVLKDASDVPCRLQRVLADGVVVQFEHEAFLIGYLDASTGGAERAADPQDSDATGNDPPTGIPSVDELESAVAEALANQPPPTGSQHDATPERTNDPPANATDEDCEFEKDLLNTNKWKELLRHHDE
jgi:hypothetical protein